ETQTSGVLASFGARGIPVDAVAAFIRVGHPPAVFTASGLAAGGLQLVPPVCLSRYRRKDSMETFSGAASGLLLLPFWIWVGLSQGNHGLCAAEERSAQIVCSVDQKQRIAGGTSALRITLPASFLDRQQNKNIELRPTWFGVGLDTDGS